MTNFKPQTYSIFVAALLVVTFGLRLWGAFDIAEHLDDESFHVPSAVSLAEYGAPLTSNWTHPPGGALILIATMKLFGDNPAGWRTGGILFGTATVVLLYLVAFRLFNCRASALLSAMLLVIDPYHVFYSRTTFMEIPVACFFLLFLYCLLRWHDRYSPNWLLAAGLALGCTVATKGYYALSIAIVICGSVFVALRRSDDRVLLLLRYLLCLAIIPVAVYVAANYHFFVRGHTLPEFIRMRQDAYHVLSSITKESFENSWLLQNAQKPWEWFVKPSAIGLLLMNGNYRIEYNFFPVRTVAAIALVAFAWLGIDRRNLVFLVLPGLFISVYGILLMIDRPVLPYSVLVILPFAYGALGHGIMLADVRFRANGRLAMLCAVLALVWGAYLYPLASGRSVPTAMYEPVLSRSHIWGR